MCDNHFLSNVYFEVNPDVVLGHRNTLKELFPDNPCDHILQDVNKM